VALGREDTVSVVNWGSFLLGVYLIIVGLNSFGIFFGLERIAGLVALVSGVLLVVEHTRR
jgi:hypothetical protein